MSRGGSVIAAVAGLVLAGTVPTMLRSQVPDGGLPTDTLDLALTMPGAPLTLKQVEVRVRQRPDGSSATEESARILYRDGTGKVRSEQEKRAIVIIRDPVGRQVVYLLVRERRAVRVRAPEGVKDVGFTGGSLGPAMPTGWNAKREDFPPRVIEGVECEGVRWTYVDPGNPDKTGYRELWESRSAAVIALASVSVPGEAFTARIENLVRGDPDPALFAIPPDYAITEIR
jgi:hypothetical protein